MADESVLISRVMHRAGTAAAAADLRELREMALMLSPGSAAIGNCSYPDEEEKDLTVGGAPARLRTTRCGRKHPVITLRLTVQGRATHVIEATTRSGDPAELDRLEALLASTRICNDNPDCPGHECFQDAEEPPLLLDR